MRAYIMGYIVLSIKILFDCADQLESNEDILSIYSKLLSSMEQKEKIVAPWNLE
jgi:hypothetical protein